jgi:hypothetical protein
MACMSPQTATASAENANSRVDRKKNIFYSDLRSRMQQSMRHKQHGQRDIYKKFITVPLPRILQQFLACHQYSAVHDMH